MMNEKMKMSDMIQSIGYYIYRTVNCHTFQLLLITRSQLIFNCPQMLRMLFRQMLGSLFTWSLGH